MRFFVSDFNRIGDTNRGNKELYLYTFGALKVSNLLNIPFRFAFIVWISNYFNKIKEYFDIF